MNEITGTSNEDADTRAPLDRGRPAVIWGEKSRAAMPVIVIVLLLVLLVAVTYFIWNWRATSTAKPENSGGNSASKELMADPAGSGGEKRFALSPPVPAIKRDNQNDQAGGDQPIPVTPFGQGGQAQQTQQAQRDRYDAPLSFDVVNGNQFRNQQQPNAKPTAAPKDYAVQAADIRQAVPPVPPATPAAPAKGSLNLGTMKTPKAKAELLGNRDFVLAKGEMIDCVLDTAMNSTLPGMSRCKSTRDVYSDNGQVVLIPRGSTITGEYKADMQPGMARIQVIWNRIRTPEGVVIEPDSPASDALGRGGLDGEVDNHWGQRVGAAFLLSTIKDAVAYKIATDGQSGLSGMSFQNTQATSNQLADTILKQTINIPPTLERPQGTRVKIVVARDLDFSGVYALKMVNYPPPPLKR